MGPYWHSPAAGVGNRTSAPLHLVDHGLKQRRNLAAERVDLHLARFRSRDDAFVADLDEPRLVEPACRRRGVLRPTPHCASDRQPQPTILGSRPVLGLELLSARNAEIEPGDDVGEMTTRRATIVDEFLESLRAERNVTELTIKAYRCDLRGFIRHMGPRLLEAARADVEEYARGLVAARQCGSTIRRKLGTVRRFFEWRRLRTGTEIPALGFRSRTIVEARVPRVAREEELQALLAAAWSDRTRTAGAFIRSRDRAVIEILVSTGMRSFELVTLDLDDVDPISRRIRVYGKGRRERILYYPRGDVARAVELYVKVRVEMQAEDRALFINRFGRRLGVQSVNVALHRLARRGKVQRRITAHMLRHSFATLLIERGADTRSVQEILGHSSVRTTERYLTITNRRKEMLMTELNPRLDLGKVWLG